MRPRLIVLVTGALAAAAATAVLPGTPSTAVSGAARIAAVHNVAAAASGAGAFTPVGPKRILDTRKGLGISSHLTKASTRTLQVSGTTGAVPSSGAAAVVFNLTVTNAASAGFVTVWPYGQSRPTVSNINFGHGWTGANLVTVRLGTGGKVSFYNSSTGVDIIGDVVGWYSDSSSSGTGNFQQVQPIRLWDSRPSSSLPGSHKPMGGRDTLAQPVDLNNGSTSANGHTKALVVTITAVDPDSSGYLAAWSGVGSAPTASVLNYTAHSIVPNLAVVPASPCVNCGTSTGLPSISIYNGSNGHTDILIDLWGFYDDGSLSGGMRFTPLTSPVRIVDTRTGLGGAHTLGSASTRHILAPGSVADAATQLLVQNVTSIPSDNTFLTFWPHGVSRPAVSNLNPRAHHTVAGLAYTGVGLSNDFDFYNATGTNDVLVDVAGTMEATG